MTKTGPYRLMMQQQPALVLHVRPYRETSAIVQFMTKDNGRISGVARGVRGAAKRVNSIQPFSLGTLSYFGRNNLVNVSKFDVAHGFTLRGDALFAGFYILELLNRLVAERQKEPVIFAGAVSALTAMEAGRELQTGLRCFELDLLEQLGYEVVFDREAEAGMAINPDHYYRYKAQFGFARVADAAVIESDPALIQGRWLHCIQRRDFSHAQVRRAAKYIARQALQPLLGDKPLVSRKMLGSR